MSRNAYAWILILTVFVALSTVAGALAQTQPFYHKKIVEIIVCTKVGGGYDTDARLIAPYLQEQLP